MHIKSLSFAIILLTMMTTFVFAESETVFSGVPILKISEGGVEQVPEILNRKQAQNQKCVISKIGENYYWASRENTSMVIIESGAFITFLAVNGSGYVRVVSPGMKQVASLMSDTESKFDYVEHMLIGLRSVTYYGSSD